MQGCYTYAQEKIGKKSAESSGDHSNKNVDNGVDQVALVSLCDQFEDDRLERNLLQPRSMENYTDLGFAKVTAPTHVKHLLQSFFERNQKYSWDEFWNPGNTYTNYWVKPTMALEIGRKDYPQGLTDGEKRTIVKSVQSALEKWLQRPLVFSAMQGIRCYQSGAVLPEKVNRLPLVASAILHVSQTRVTGPTAFAAGQVEQDATTSATEESDDGYWPLQVIGHDGQTYNVTQSKTGDNMILYEGSSVIHGRPYPLEGEYAYYCTLEVHFEPLGHTARHELRLRQQRQQQKYGQVPTRHSKRFHQDRATTPGGESSSTAKAAFDMAFQAQQELYPEPRNPSSSPSSSVPHYIWPVYESGYRQQASVFESEPSVYPKSTKMILGKINAHTAASMGDLIALKELAKTNRNELFKADLNGWRPLHEAARSGHADIIEYLLEEGAKVNERTNNNQGGNPLFWAEKEKVKNAKAIEVLKRYGAVNLPPVSQDLRKEILGSDGDEKKADKAKESKTKNK